MKSKKNKRNQTKYPALRKELNLKSRYDQIGDIDYLAELSDELKEYLNNFYEEFINTNFNHEGKRVHPKKLEKKVVKRTGKEKIIDVYKQESEGRNNSRNRCIFTKARAAGMLLSTHEVSDINTNSSIEDDLIDKIDKKHK